jgi:hypothetical protein
MDSSVVQRQIRELEDTRKKTRALRLGFSLALLAIVLGCMGLISSSLRGLMQPGPAQDEFSRQLSSNLQRDVLPRVQTIAGQTLTVLRPQVEAEFSKLNARAPEISGLALQHLQTLNQNVAKKGETTLEETFGAMLAKKEAKIRTMFPHVKEGQIKNMMQHVSTEAQNRIMQSHNALLSPHMNQLNGIVGSLTTIQAQEYVNPMSRDTDVELVTSVLDLMRPATGATSVKPVAYKPGMKPMMKPAMKSGGASGTTKGY